MAGLKRRKCHPGTNNFFNGPGETAVSGTASTLCEGQAGPELKLGMKNAPWKVCFGLIVAGLFTHLLASHQLLPGYQNLIPIRILHQIMKRSRQIGNQHSYQAERPNKTNKICDLFLLLPSKETKIREESCLVFKTQ